MLTDAEARAAVSSLPWVAHSPKLWPGRCEAIRRRGRAELAAAELHLRADVRAKHRCKRSANWVFLSLGGKINVWCFQHLWLDGLHGSEEERLRFRAAAYRWDWHNYSPELDPEDTELPG